MSVATLDGIPVSGSLHRVSALAVRDLAPVFVGIIPFALLLGVATADADIPPGTGLVGSLLIYAGTANLSAVLLLQDGAGLLAVVATVAVVNARFVMYGAALEHRFRAQPGWFRWLAPHFLVDQTFAMAQARAGLDEPRAFRRYWLALGFALGAAWVGTVAVGMALGPVLPAQSPLGFAAPALFIGMLVPQLAGCGAAVTAALTAGLTTLAASPAPNGSSVLIGSVAGVVAGTVAARGRS